MLRRKMLAVMLVIAMVLTMAACGQQQKASEGKADETIEGSDDTTDTKVSETASSGVTEIRFSWWGSEERNERYNAICDLFEEANPDVKVLREPATWEDFWVRLSTQSAGGNAPTLFGMNPLYVTDYALRGVLADLEPFIENGTIDTTNIDEAVVEAGRVGENIIMVSQGVTFQAYLANTTLLDKYGVDYPASNEDWTWEDFARESKAYADRAKESGERTWFSGPLDDQLIHYRSFAREMGKDVFDANGNVDIDTARLAQWWEFWQDLRAYGAVPQPSEWLEDAQKPLEQRALATGEVALQVFPVNQLELWQNASDGIFDIIRFPMDVNQTNRSEIVTGSYFTVSAAAALEEQEAAARLINFFVNNGDAIDIFLLEQGVPANSKMGERIMDVLSESQQKGVAFVNDMMQIAGPDVPQPLGATEIEQLYTSIAEQVVHKMITAQEGAEQFAAEAQAVLERED